MHRYRLCPGYGGLDPGEVGCNNVLVDLPCVVFEGEGHVSAGVALLGFVGPEYGLVFLGRGGLGDHCSGHGEADGTDGLGRGGETRDEIRK